MVEDEIVEGRSNKVHIAEGAVSNRIQKSNFVEKVTQPAKLIQLRSFTPSIGLHLGCSATDRRFGGYSRWPNPLASGR